MTVVEVPAAADRRGSRAPAAARRRLDRPVQQPIASLEKDPA